MESTEPWQHTKPSMEATRLFSTIGSILPTEIKRMSTKQVGLIIFFKQLQFTVDESLEHANGSE